MPHELLTHSGEFIDDAHLLGQVDYNESPIQQTITNTNKQELDFGSLPPIDNTNFESSTTTTSTVEELADFLSLPNSEIPGMELDMENFRRNLL